ncbi:MAG: hypothetical protein IPJ81_06230 [Chitinophagaceae bacterium]|nr:hypothetical protein [Chitinophagaceae bacterium]
MIDFTEILRYASNLSPLFPIILLFTIKKKRTKIINIFIGVILVSFLSDIVGFIMVSNRINNAPVSNSYYIIQFFLLMYFYNIQIKNKKLIYITIVVFISFCVINTIFLHPFNRFQSWLRFVGAIICIFYAVGFFRQMARVDKAEGRWIDNPPIDPFYHYPFWINAGIFYYFAFNLFLFAMDNFVFTNLSKEVARTFWGFHNANNIIKNLLFGIAVIVFKNKNKSPLFY